MLFNSCYFKNIKYYRLPLLTITVYSLLYFQAYYSMYNLRDSISSSCIKCTYLEDIAIYTAISTIVFLLIYILSSLIKAFKKLQNLLLFFTFVYLCYLENKYIFIDRETSWSTYTFEVSSYILKISSLHITITAIIFIAVLYLSKAMNLKKIALFIVFIISLRFFFGIYSDPEFGDKWPFIKHSPTWKWYFYSPLGMSDKKLQDLNPHLKKEEILFRKYINNR